jgi:predicted phosphodiesterase
MRIAVLADIHGNQAAFTAALEDTIAQKADRIVLIGDVVIGSPDSQACWEMAQSLGCPILRGNHERYAALYGGPEAPPEWDTEKFLPVQWAAGQLPDETRRAMGSLPTHLRLEDAPGVLFVHASLRDDHDTVSPFTPEERLDAMFPGTVDRWIIRGHNHLAQVRLWRGGLIVTTGSTGLPLDASATAQYLLLDQARDGWRIQHRAVPYPLETSLRRFNETGYLDATGPIGRLYYREVKTASPQIVPFLRWYAHWQREEPITLAAGVERFLGDP